MSGPSLIQRSQNLLQAIDNSPVLMPPNLAQQVDDFWLDCKRDGSDAAIELGMRVTMGGVPMTPGLQAFAQKQAWHHSLRSVGCRLANDGSIPYVSNGEKRTAQFEQLTKEASDGKTMYKAPNGDTVFETDENGRITIDFTPTYRGIEAHNIYKDGMIAHYKDVGDGTYRMEVKTILSHAQGEDGVGACFGQHTYINLIAPTGEHYSVGKYGQFEPEQRQWHSYTCPGGRMPGRIMCPDEYVYRRPSHHSYKDFTFILNAAQYGRVENRFRAECLKTDHVFSLCHNNCESWVTDVLKKELNFEIDPAVSVTYFFYGSLPDFMLTALNSLKAHTFDVLPSSFQSAVSITLSPLYYVASVVCGIATYLLCFINWEGYEGGDFSFTQIFDMSMTLDLPVAVRKSLNEKIPHGTIDISTAC